MYIEIIDFSPVSITALKCAIFLDIFSLTKLYYHVEVDDDIEIRDNWSINDKSE